MEGCEQGGCRKYPFVPEEKSTFVRWNNDTRKEYFGIVAKKVAGKEELRQRGYLVFDLDDID